MFLLNTMRALEICPLTLPSWKRNVNDRGLERALAILSMRSYAIGRLHDFASEPFSAGFRTNLCGKHRNGSTQKAPRQQTFKFEEVRGRHHREARLCSYCPSLTSRKALSFACILTPRSRSEIGRHLRAVDAESQRQCDTTHTPPFFS